jgi:hypothetical protein
MRDLYCWSRWYAMRNNPHQEGSLPQFTNCLEEVFSETQRHRMSRGCTQTETQRSVVGLLVHACRPQPRLLYKTSFSNDLLGATTSTRSYWLIPRCLRLSLPFPQGSLSASANHPLYGAPFPGSLHARRAGTESPE